MKKRDIVDKLMTHDEGWESLYSYVRAGLMLEKKSELLRMLGRKK